MLFFRLTLIFLQILIQNPLYIIENIDILVVEDNPADARLIAETIKETGKKVELHFAF